MGLVELYGMARLRKQQKSPLTHMDACWWNCRVQEYRQNGENSHWVTIKQVSSVDFFYLEDETGRVLISPLGAEFHILSNSFDLNASTRTTIAPVLNSWGIDDMTWFGTEQRLQIIEQVIPDCAPLFVMGELVSIGEHLEDRQACFNARLREIKADPVKMAEVDTNHDGIIDPEEWDAFRAKQEEEFLKEELARQNQMPNQDSMLIKAPSASPYIVSTESDTKVESSFQWFTSFGVCCGIALCAFGIWQAVLIGWGPTIIVGLLGFGLLLNFLIQKFGT